MILESAGWLPPSTGWSWQVMRRDELSLAWPLLWIVEGQKAKAWLVEAELWMAGQGERRGIVAVHCALGTISGLFGFAVDAGGPHARLTVDRVISLELFAPNRTLAAILRAVRDLGEIHACCEIRLYPPCAWAVDPTQGFADVVARLGFVRGGQFWQQDLDMPLRNVVNLPTNS